MVLLLVNNKGETQMSCKQRRGKGKVKKRRLVNVGDVELPLSKAERKKLRAANAQGKNFI